MSEKIFKVGIFPDEISQDFERTLAFKIDKEGVFANMSKVMDI